MHDFRYVTKNEAKIINKELYQILYKVQDLIRDKFTFSFSPIGSSSHNMITYDTKSNIGFDFDINIEVNDDNEDYEPKEIRTIIRTAIDCIAPRYGYGFCEDSTRVLTIKRVNTFSSRIIHSCDFAIVYNCSDGRQQYIRFNKDNNYYSWEYQGKGFIGLNQKIDWLKKNHCGKNCRIIISKRKMQTKIPTSTLVQFLPSRSMRCVRKMAIANSLTLSYQVILQNYRNVIF